MDAHFSAGFARRVVGLSQRCLDYWDDRAVISPSVAADGKGSERRYSFEDLVKLSVVKHLRDAGLSLQRIRKGLRALARTPEGKQALLRQRLITDGKSLHRLTDNPGFVEDVLKGGQLVLSIVAVGKIEAELKARVVRIDESPRPRLRTGTAAVRRKRARA